MWAGFRLSALTLGHAWARFLAHGLGFKAQGCGLVLRFKT